MHYFIESSQDATIYRKTENILQNTGLDEILEVQKYIDTNSQVFTSRALIQFDISSISASLAAGSITNPKYYLNLYISEAIEVPIDYTIYAYPISSSWNMGTGYKFDNPQTTNGASWLYREGTGGATWSTSSLAPNVTSSGDFGGTYYTSSVASQSFSYESADMRMDITNIVSDWLSSSYENNGLLLKFSDSNEEDALNYGIFSFFSKETNTIYEPKLETVWDDSSFVTGSLSALTDENIVINLTNLKSNYKKGSRIKFRVRGREQYPTKTFVTSSVYSVNKYLPETTYYSIEDAEHDTVIIPFDDYSKLSSDSTGNYFDLWLDEFSEERFYSIKFKVERNGNVEYYDNNHIFKVVK